MRKTGKIPIHVAFTLEGAIETAHGKKLQLSDQLAADFVRVRQIAEAGFDLRIPVLTFDLLPSRQMNSEHFMLMIDAVVKFFTDTASWDYIDRNQVKVTVLGRWYDLPGRAVEQIKRLIEETKDYDQFFLNLCVCYDGHEEILSACQLIARQVRMDRLDPESITSQTIKENLYTSYFVPPDIIVKTGREHCTSGLLLWDSANSHIYFTEKPWHDFAPSDLSKAIESHQKDHAPR